MTQQPDRLSPRGLVAYVKSAMVEGPFSPESAERLADLMRRFARYAEDGCGIECAAQVMGPVAAGFVRARAADGSQPAVATMHLRRSAVRLLFAEGRRLGLVENDPTFDLLLPARTTLRARPLTDEEVALCRSHSVRTMSETRQPAAWALAEATARSAELTRIRAADVDLSSSQVWIAGGSKTEPRWGRLSEWGTVQLERLLDSVKRPGAPLVCPVARPGASATSSASKAIAETLRRAGLHHEADVRPPSVASWAGARAFAAGAPIDEVARMLGIRSLDRTAEFIGYEWRNPPGDQDSSR